MVSGDGGTAGLEIAGPCFGEFEEGRDVGAIYLEELIVERQLAARHEITGGDILVKKTSWHCVGAVAPSG